MSTPSIDYRASMAEREIYEIIEKEMPALWRACYPRIYREPKSGIYCASKTPARQLASIAIKVMQGHMGRSEVYEFQLASHLTKFLVPTYWISPDMAEALKLTEPPAAFNWYEMPLPFEAGIFMLPKGTLVHPVDGDVLFICYSRMRSGSQHFAPLIPQKPYGSINGGMVIAAAVGYKYFIHWNVPLDKFGSTLTMVELYELMMQYRHDEHDTGLSVTDTTMSTADHDLGLQVAHMLFSTLLLMNARPELVTPATLVNRVPAKKGREAREFWSPHIIGEHYKLRRDPRPSMGGTHSSPRLHWVKGFWREQPHGPQRSLRKSLWIEPYMRGVDQE